MANVIYVNPFGNNGGNGGGDINIATEVEKNNHNAVESDAVYRYINNRSEAFGRFWNESNATPVAAGYIGSIDKGRDFINWLELGRYLVTDDRRFTKLDPADSNKYKAGGAVVLDGTMGQLMWCWCDMYYGTWQETINNSVYTYEVISKQPTFEGHTLRKIPRGGTSWLGAGVWEASTGKLCSLISNDADYRGGGGSALDPTVKTLLSADMPQCSMLGMPRTQKSTTAFGTAARLRGEGWEANWFVAEFVVSMLERLYFGNRHIQAARTTGTDTNGLPTGGLGSGVTGIASTVWNEFNGYYPLIPNSFSVLDSDGNNVGDFTGVKNYAVKDKDGNVVYETPVPFFAGLMNPSYGHLWRCVRGLIIDIATEGTSDVYVTPSMSAAYDHKTVADKLFAGNMARSSGYITELILDRFAGIPAKVGGTSSTRYPDYLYTDPSTYNGLRVRLAGGGAAHGAFAGSAYSTTYNAASYATAYLSAPLCVFAEDPIVS